MASKGFERSENIVTFSNYLNAMEAGREFLICLESTQKGFRFSILKIELKFISKSTDDLVKMESIITMIFEHICVFK